MTAAALSPAPDVADGVGAAAGAAGVGFRGPDPAGPSLFRPKFGLIWIRDRLVDMITVDYPTTTCKLQDAAAIKIPSPNARRTPLKGVDFAR